MGQLTREQRQQIAFESRVAFLSSLIHTATQLGHLSCPWQERWQRLLSLVVAAVPLFFSRLYPHIYLKYQGTLYFLFKIAFFSFPLLRKPKGIQRVLDSPAQPGIIGFFLDVLRMLWGTRAFSLIWIGIVTRHSLILYSIGQIFGFAMLRLNDSLCSTTLLQDPLTQERLRLFNSMTTQLFLPYGSTLYEWIKSTDCDCSFFLTTLLMLFGASILITVVAISGEKLGTRSKIIAWLLCGQLTWVSSFAITVLPRT